MIAAVSTFCTSFMALMRNETLANTGNWHAMVTDVKMRDVSAFENAGFDPEVTLSQDTKYARLASSKNENKPYLMIRKFDEKGDKNFPVKLITGRMPRNNGEIVLSKHLETNGGIKHKVGDTLTLNIGKRTYPGAPADFTYGQDDAYQGKVFYKNGEYIGGEVFTPEKFKKYTVVGIFKRPNFESSWCPGYTAITRLDKEVLGPDDTVTVTLLAGKLRHTFFDEVAAVTKSIGVDSSHILYNSELLRYSGVMADNSAQNMIYGFAAVFIAIIMIASVSLIYNAFSISVSERVRQLGMLASVGATMRQKQQSIYFEGFILGIIGIPLGLLAGVAGIGVTLSIIRPLIKSSLHLSSEIGLVLHVSFASVAAAAVLAALTIFISVWIPARRASKTMPIDAIRQSKEVKLTRKTVRTSWITRAIFGLEGELALKNLKRNRKKYRATVLSLIISLVLFLTASFYTKTIKVSSSSMDEGYNFDIASYIEATDSEMRKINNEIASLEGVTNIAEVKDTAGHFLPDKTQLSKLGRRLISSDDNKDHSLTATLYSLDDTTFNRYVRDLGADPKEYRDPSHPKIVLINYGQDYVNGKRTAGEIFSIKEGDHLRFCVDAPDKAEPDDVVKDVQLDVGLLTHQRPMGVYKPSLYNIAAVASKDVFDSLSNPVRTYLTDSDEESSFRVLVMTAKNPDAVETQILKLTQGLEDRTHIFNVTAQARREYNMMLVLNIFIYGFIILISLICTTNIFNTVNSNISLRRKEFAMLRSVGMTPGSFNRMIRFESIFYGLKALLYGIPISIAIALLLYRIQSDVFDTGFSLPWASYAAAIVLIFAIVSMTMYYSSSKVRKENIIDGLKVDGM